jgi:predicted Ser/Thr protein kinase
LQGRCLLARGLASQQDVAQAWATLQQHGGGQDLCALLVSWGRLSPQHAADVRREVTRATSSGGWPTLPASATSAADQTVVAAPPGLGPTDRTVLATPPGAGPTDQTVLAGPPGSLAPPHETVAESHETLDAGLGDFGRYELKGELSRGGMGVVYRARHRRLGQEVALKVILQRSASAEQLSRFDREAKTLARLEHPNIVRVTDYGDTDGVPFFAMQLVKGRDLKKLVDQHLKRHRRPPDPAWVARIMTPIAEALVACHEQGVIHRDLKPHNVLVERKTEQPVLVDFGLVRQDDPEATEAKRMIASVDPTADASLTQAGALLGTPGYMAPEQVDAEDFGEVDDHTDVWGFGATLFYCLTGKPPYDGTTAVNVYKKILTEDPPDVAHVRRGIPGWLASLCRQCLDRNPRGRPSMEEVHQSLLAHTRSRRGAYAAAAGVILLFAAANVTWWLWPNPGVESVAPLPAWTSEAEVRVHGTTVSAGARVVLEHERESGWEVVKAERLPARGFDWTVALAPGANRFRIVVEDADEEPTLLEIGRDMDAPKLRLDHLQGGGVILPTPTTPVSGVVLDDSPVEVWVDGQPADVQDDGAFRIAVPAKAPPHDVTVRVRDAGGRVVEEVRRIHRHLAALFDRQAWQEAPVELQDLAIAEAAAELGEAYHLELVHVFECGGEAHRIAVFVHRATGAYLHLVPGGEYWIGNQNPSLIYGRQWDIAAREFEFLRSLGGTPEHHPAKKDPNARPPATYDPDSVMGNERPKRKLRIPPFLIGATELLEREWAAVEGAPEARLGPNDQVANDDPQVWIDWDTTQEWLELAGGGLAPAPFTSGATTPTGTAATRSSG